MTVIVRPDGWLCTVERWAAAAAVTVAGLWALQRGDALGGLVAGGVALVAGAWAWDAARAPTCRLGWNGAAWTLARVATGAPSEAIPGRSTVVLDLGDWLLLRFVPDGSPRAAVRWLALARSEQASAWHGLRCALYGPTPAEGAA